MGCKKAKLGRNTMVREYYGTVNFGKLGWMVGGMSIFEGLVKKRVGLLLAGRPSTPFVALLLGKL